MDTSIAKVSGSAATDPTSTVTTRPQDPLIPLIDQIRELVADEHREDPIAHVKLLSVIHDLNLAVETPMDTIFRMGYQSWQHAAIRVALDLGIFDILVEREPQPVIAKELASRYGADVVLVGKSSHQFALVALIGH